MSHLVLSPNYGEAEERFWKQLVICEEDRPQFTTSKQHGAFRWFKSPNIVPIEKYRRPLSPNGGQRAA
jgi:hypothetical protein